MQCGKRKGHHKGISIYPYKITCDPNCPRCYRLMIDTALQSGRPFFHMQGWGQLTFEDAPKRNIPAEPPSFKKLFFAKFKSFPLQKVPK